MDSCCEDRLLGCSSQLRNKARTFGYVLHFLWIIAVTTVVWINEDNGDLPRSFPSDLCLNAALRGQQPTSSWQPLPDLAAPLATRLLCAPSALWGCCALSGSALHQPGLLCLAMPSAPWQPELPPCPAQLPRAPVPSCCWRSVLSPPSADPCSQDSSWQVLWLECSEHPWLKPPTSCCPFGACDGSSPRMSSTGHKGCLETGPNCRMLKSIGHCHKKDEISIL